MRQQPHGAYKTGSQGFLFHPPDHEASAHSAAAAKGQANGNYCPSKTLGWCSLVPLVEELHSNIGKGPINDLWFLPQGEKKKLLTKECLLPAVRRVPEPTLRSLCSL